MADWVPDHRPEAQERALAAIIESGRARLSQGTLLDLRRACEALEDPTAERSAPTTAIGGIRLTVDNRVPHGYITPDPPTTSDGDTLHHQMFGDPDWRVRMAMMGYDELAQASTGKSGRDDDAWRTAVLDAIAKMRVTDG